MTQNTPELPKCSLCGEPMPEGETMFMYHGYSGPCPKPPMAKTTPELKPCPFCGSIFVEHEENYFTTYCTNCPAEIQASFRDGLNSKDRSKALWNTRAPATPSPKTMRSAEKWLQNFPIREVNVGSEREWLLMTIRAIQTDAQQAQVALLDEMAEALRCQIKYCSSGSIHCTADKVLAKYKQGRE
jgi:Restriction alleviation protein Lar